MAKEEKKEIFQDKALEQLSSPEQLDQLLQVVDRKSWLPLTVTGAAIFLALLWSIFGRIPITVDGVGILVYPRQVVSFQSPASGQIVTLDVKVGDFVDKDQVLGRINQPQLEQRLQQEQVRLAERLERQKRSGSLGKKRIKLETDAFIKKRKLLIDRIKGIEDMAARQKKQNERYIEQQRRNLESVRVTTKQMGAALEQRYESQKTLKAEGLSSDDALLNARQNFISNQIRGSDLEVQTQELELREIEAENNYLKQMDLIADLRAQLQELEITEAQLTQRQIETSSDSELEVNEIRRNIARLESELKTSSRIGSEYRGRILEITGASGQIVSAGQRLGSVEAEDPRGKLVAVTYFQVADGKKINKDIPIRITPTTVERERFGSINGQVISVSPFPVTTDAVTNVVGNHEIAQELTDGASRIEVFSALVEDPATVTGFKWTSGAGPDVEITAGTTVSVRATIDFRRPITFVIPILRRWSGV